jgi:hypothetical protein
MPTPLQGTPQEGTPAAKEPVIETPTSPVSSPNPAKPGQTGVVIPSSGPQGESTIEGGPVLHGTYAPVDVPHPTQDPGVNSGFGPKKDNYDDHPDLGIDGLN